MSTVLLHNQTPPLILSFIMKETVIFMFPLNEVIFFLTEPKFPLLSNASLKPAVYPDKCDHFCFCLLLLFFLLVQASKVFIALGSWVRFFWDK